MTGTSRSQRVWTGLGALVVLAVFAFSAWRVWLPNNRHRDLDFHRTAITGPIDFQRAKTANGYDDVVTQVTARNFVRDGFARTHFLPNRKGGPQVSFFDFTRTQCESGIPREKVAPTYADVYGQPTPMVALSDDCIYTHYPPLADWVFGAMATVGADSIVHYKLLAVLLNCGTLLLLFLWMRREVSAPAAAVSILATATLPAFYQWAAALFYQPFQYLFLSAGLLSWSRFLVTRRLAWFVITWVLFFLEALVSYELVLCFGLVLAGLFLIDPPQVGWRTRVNWIMLQASAPVSAVLLHVGLQVSLLGAGRVWSNAAKTLQTRSGADKTLIGQSLLELGREVGLHILRWELWLLALAMLVGVRVTRGAPLKRPLALLGVLLVGGVSFSVAFPATSIFHFWMMYRHLLPFVAFSLALLTDSVVLSIGSGWRKWPPLRVAPTLLAIGGAALSAVPLIVLFARNAAEITAEVRWNIEANRAHHSNNSSPRFLDVLYWKSAGFAGWEERLYMAVDGRRVNWPPNPNTEFRVHPGTISHYEIWWLDPVRVASLSILTDRIHARWIGNGCKLEVLCGEDVFRAATLGEAPEVSDFVPAPGEPSPPARSYAWVRFALTGDLSARAVRITCGVSPEAVPFHEIEVL